jgi:hypothetical protein
MVQNLTGVVAPNVKEAALTISYDLNLAVIIAAIAVLITLLGILYKYGQQVGEFRGIKQVIEAKFESFNEKYITSEKIQNIELKIQKIELNIENKIDKDNVNTHVYEITNQLSKLGEEIEALKKQKDDLKKEFENHQILHAPKQRGGVE